MTISTADLNIMSQKYIVTDIKVTRTAVYLNNIEQRNKYIGIDATSSDIKNRVLTKEQLKQKEYYKKELKQLGRIAGKTMLDTEGNGDIREMWRK